MANNLTDVIKRLEQQRAGIDRALEALRDIEGIAGETQAATSEAAPASDTATSERGGRRGGMTPEGRRRLSEALRARWAAKRAGKSAGPAKQATAKRTGGMTPEGRRRLSEALKKRWAAKRAGSTAKKAARKS